MSPVPPSHSQPPEHHHKKVHESPTHGPDIHTKKQNPMAASKDPVPPLIRLEDTKYGNVKQEDLAKISSISPDCNKLKESYDACFIKWYSDEFLPGKSVPNCTPCEELFNEYQKCIKNAIKRKDIPTYPGYCP